MKNLLLSIVLALTAQVSMATSVDRTAVVAQVKGFDQGVESAAVLADGRMQIKVKDQNIKTVQLTKAALNRVIGYASAISGTKLRIADYMAVCEMVKLNALDDLYVGTYNSNDQKFVGNNLTLTLTLTDLGCTTSHQVEPTEEYTKAYATLLREIIVVLAFQSVK